jgi:beta-phosphoglucomutase family hydrolase
MLKAVIFDWDGVIIDSREAHRRSWDILAEETKLTLPEGHFERGFGQTNLQIMRTILKWQLDEPTLKQLDARKGELYRMILRADGIEPLAGVRELLEEILEANIPCIVGTSTSRTNLDLALELTGLAPYLSRAVTGAEVKFGKPHPEVFLKAAEKLGIEPKSCVVIEDTHHGIEAALAGNMKAVAVATTHPIETFPMANLAVEGMHALTLKRLQALF